ncbi:MAG TPA: PAS domain S-box protein [Bryobacteraceae bacterium]|nr:PAS domain S-box protein [Bryobacteraceae bacterium]
MAWRYYVAQKEAVEQEVRNQLLAIAELKVTEISEWRSHRIGEARALLANGLGMAALERLASGKSNEAERAQIHNWLQEICRSLLYASANFMDEHGKVLLSVGRRFGDEEHLRKLTVELLQRNDIQLRSFHLDEPSSTIHMGLNVPLRPTPVSRPFGALLLGIDPADYLYPLLQRWPPPSQTAETLLVTRDGDDVVYLNDLRYRRNAALRLRIPLSHADLPGAQAVQGAQGNVEGTDYRGVKVFAAVRPVPDTPWFLVAKMDAEEVRAPIRRRSSLMAAAAVSLILAAGTGVFLLWRRQQLQFYRAHYESELERKSLDEKLRNMLDRLSAVIEASPAAILSFNPDFQVMTWNRAAERMFGWAAEEVIGAPLPIVPEDRKEYLHQLAARVTAGEVITGLRGYGQTRDGRRIDISVSAAPLHDLEGRNAGVALNLIDITEHAKAEEALQQSESRFRVIFDQAAVGVNLVSLDGRFLRVNRRYCEITGYSEEEVLQRRFRDITHPDDMAEDRERARRLLEGEVDTASVDQRYIRKDGSEVWVHMTSSLLRSASGEPLHFLGMVEDITERKRAEQEKLRLEEQLRHAQRMESLGRLAGGVAHDFNNHLTVITGYCDMLLTRLEPGDPQRAELEEIRAAGDRAAALTLQLLAFSRKQIAEPRPLNLNDVISEGGKMLRRLIGEDIEIVTRLDPAAGMVVADRGQMNQVLMNLVINARDAMPSGGRIVIEMTNVEFAPGAIELPNDAAPGAYVALSLSDTGVGMSPETLQHIFEPFFTTKGAGIGTGLGLSTVYGIVQQSRGWIRASSQPGQGSTFQIYLPRAESDATGTTPISPEAEVPRGFETILVVEDQEKVRQLALRILKENGYQLLEAADGPAALALSESFPGRIHLLLTDVVMPGMTGRELAARVQNQRPQTRVLFISGYAADVISREGALDAGVAYLPKPFTPAQLSVKVREVLGQAKSVATILVIDDDEGVRGLLKQVLVDAGYLVLTAGDGKAGVRLIKQNAIDLVLTDLIMPDQEGLETIRLLRRDQPTIKVVAMSGAIESVYLKTASMLGAQVALSKPIQPEELLRVVRELLS